jgi:HAD superfamily hydrolase (TIGR01549 family)
VVKQRLDFPAIKREMFGDSEGFILERMEKLGPAERARAEAILERHEAAAAEHAESMDGFLPFHGWLASQGVKSGLVTRNSRKSVEVVLTRLALRFDAVVSREDAPPKPAPDPVLLACRRMGVEPGEAMFVGDFEFDLVAGRRAGVMTVLLTNPACRFSERADLVIDSLAELRACLDAGASAPR